MKKALVLGASGLVGSAVLSLLLQLDDYAVTVLVRKPLNITHDRLTQVVFDYDHPQKELVVADELFCCLGTTIKDAGSQSAFYKVDFTYVYEVARLGFENGALKMALVSSVGADKDSRIFYSKTKGAIEAAVADIGFSTCYVFRPSLLLGNRRVKRTGESIAQWLLPRVSWLMPARYKPIKAITVAAAMVSSMQNDNSGFHVISSDQIASLGSRYLSR